jgi:hypothetical protein
VKISESGKSAILQLAGGDLRRVLNLLQSSHMSYPEITEEVRIIIFVLLFWETFCTVPNRFSNERNFVFFGNRVCPLDSYFHAVYVLESVGVSNTRSEVEACRSVLDRTFIALEDDTLLKITFPSLSYEVHRIENWAPWTSIISNCLSPLLSSAVCAVLQIVYLTAGAAVPAVIEETFQSLLNDSFNEAYEKINKVGSTSHLHLTPLYTLQENVRSH